MLHLREVVVLPDPLGHQACPDLLRERVPTRAGLSTEEQPLRPDGLLNRHYQAGHPHAIHLVVHFTAYCRQRVCPSAHTQGER